MDSGDNYDVAEFFFTPELLISQSKNEAFGHPDTTTLLPLDPATLEVICRVNLPGVPLVGREVVNCFDNHGFFQFLLLHTGADFGTLCVEIFQCSSHADALKAMKRVLKEGSANEWLSGHRYEGLGNYAVEIEYDLHSKRRINLIWVRWTTVIKIQSTAIHDLEGFPDHRLVHIKPLASALDKAMKAHHGTVSQVPKVAIGLKQSDIPIFNKEGQTEKIRITFQADTHPHRWFLVDGDPDAAFDVADGPTGSQTSSDGKGPLTWNSCSEDGHNFPESGIISLRCKKLDYATLTIKLAHRSSLWPTEETFYF